MELRNINTFTKVAELESFSKAAEHLGYSQSTVTIQIKQLETELNTKLFDRMGHKIMLTNSGRALLTHAKDLLLMEQKVKGIVQDTGSVKGVLRLGLIESICTSLMPDILPRYHALYPDVEIQVITDVNENLIEMLKTNDVDLAFLIDKKICTPDTVTAYEFPQNILFVASRDFSLPHDGVLSLKEIAAMPFILTEKGISYRLSLDDLLATHNLSLTPFLEIGDTSTIRDLIKKNMGVSILPEFAVNRRLEKGDIINLKVEHWDVTLYTQLIYNKHKWMTPAMQKFIDLVADTYGKKEDKK
ncbi:MAG: LysR family transcriptional regulator [Lachnospiraceae bacterium]|nr:LysR family transcriptional regulator [Lachnospiraceae bacterium]